MKAVADAIEDLNKRIAEMSRQAASITRARGELDNDRMQMRDYLIKHGYKDVLMVLEEKNDGHRKT